MLQGSLSLTVHPACINRYDSGITPSQIYDINQLEGMRLAQTAWNDVDASTIRHCWLKAGILPELGLFNQQPSPSPNYYLLLASCR
jgi:hypothetical protein